jgi:hypothetical protein
MFKADWMYGLHGLDEEQKEHFLRAKEFAIKNFRPHAMKWDDESYFPREVLYEVGRAGYGGMAVSKQYGGQQLSRKNISAIVEALASECVSTTAYITIHNGVLAMIDKFASPAIREKYVPDLAKMKTLASFCLTEPGSGSDAASITTTGILNAEKTWYSITGNKCFISGAGASDVLLVMFRTAEGSPLSCGIVMRENTPGLSFGSNEKKMGWKTQPTRQVHFDQMPIPVNSLVGSEGQGFKVAMVGLDGARLSIAACSLGAAADALQRSIHYVKQKGLFNEQSIQFKLAEMYEKLSAGRVILRQAAEQVDSRAPTAIQYCAIAKQICTDNGTTDLKLWIFSGLCSEN